MNGTRTATAYHLLMVSLLGALIYSNTLTSAFQFDDRLNIVDNLLIRDPGNLWPPNGARWFGTLTFSLNYLAGGLNPLGYHIVNTCIHILTALSVYLLVRLTFRSPFFRDCRGPLSGEWFAFACALLFVSHPVQTQAVTYIVQRFASLAALLFLLSLDCYILARLLPINDTAGRVQLRTGTVRCFLYAAAAFLALLSLKTKENAYTLPAVLITYEVMFIGGMSRLLAAIRRHRRIAISLSLALLAAVTATIARYGLQPLLEKLKATNEISRHDYLITQFRVIVTYIRLLFLPVGQTLDHQYRVYHSLFEPALLASLALIIALAVTAFLLYRASRNGSPLLRLVSFGIAWFFITLSVESSFIPIVDVMFEHRLYLPGIGAIIAVVALCAYALERSSADRRTALRVAAGILLIVTAALSCSAYLRNRVWKDELTLWSDVIAKTPRNPRGYNMLGTYYQTRYRIFDAIAYYSKALEVDSSYAEARSNLGNAYILTGRIDEGLKELMVAAKNNRFDEIDTGILYYNIAKGYGRKGMADQALENLDRALRFIPNEAAVYALRGEMYRLKGLADEGTANLRKAHELDPLKY